MKYQYGIAHRNDIDRGHVLECCRLTESSTEADQWLEKWKEDGGAVGAFVKIRRPVSDWELI